MRSDVVVDLMLSQYRMSKIEEIVTKNVFRVVWVAFCVYVASAGADVRTLEYAREVSGSLAFVEAFGLMAVAIVFFGISSRVTAFMRRQSVVVREMLVSLDHDLKDFYVEEFHRQDMRYERTPAIVRLLVMREEAIWCTSAIAIIYARLLIVFLASS